MRLFRESEGGSGSGLRRSESGAGTGNKLVAKVARAILPAGIMRDKGVKERPHFNPEDHISEKRAWSKRYMAAGTASDSRRASAGAAAEQHLFEHFAIVGLPPNTNIRSVASDIKTYQRLNRQAGGGDGAAAAATGLHITADTPREERQRQYGLKGPAVQAEVLCSFPPPSMPAELQDSLAAFCFPHGVRPELLERTPSMSALNEIIYSQPYQTHDDQSFVFLMKVVDPGSVAPRTLYGVCCYVRELVHRPPSMAKEAFPTCNAPLNRYLVVAPRCYCLLTHHPFFGLHFRVLQTILGLERLERMTSFSAELAAMELGGGRPHASPPYTEASSTSRVTSSGGGPPSSASSQSASASAASGSTRQQGWPAPAPAATTRPAAADGSSVAAAAAADDGRDEAASESGSSRRWTEGSSYCADEPPLLPLPLMQLPSQPGQQEQPGDVQMAGMLQPLSAADGQQQQQQQQRPSHPGQVSPHCPPSVQAQPQHSLKQPTAADGSPPPPAVAVAAVAAGPDAAGTLDCGGGDTPKEQVVTSAWGSAAGTPFFTPTGLTSAVCSPASRSITQQQQQQQQQLGAAQAAGVFGAGSSSVCRALEDSLGEVRGGSSSGSSRASSTSGDEHAEQALGSGLPGERSMHRLAEQRIESAINSPTASRPGSRRSAGFSAAAAGEAADDGDDGASEAGSYLTASSSTVLLGQLADGSPAQSGPASALVSPLTQSVGRTQSQAGGAGGSPLPPAAVSAPHVLEAQQQAQQQQPLQSQELHQQQQQQEQQQREAQPAVVGSLDLDQQPVVVLHAVQKGASNGSNPPPAQHTQQAERPLSQVDAADTLATTACLEQQQQEQHEAQQQQEARQQQHQAQQAPHGGARGVHIATTSISSLSLAAAHADANTPPRADLLTGGTAATRSRRQLAPLQLQPQGAGGSSSTFFEAGEDGGQGQQAGQQQQQQQPEQEVVRVTATNVDMSRPLRSRDLLATYYASVVPRPGQVFEFQPDPGLQTIAFERPDLAEAVAELGLRPDAATLPDIDAAQNLGGWAVAALCRSMSLDNVFAFLTAALLERQMVVFCPNAGLLSGIVLSVVPLLLPFHWQCLLLPVLPAGEGRLELIDAPVPFVLGVMYKTSEVRSKCGHLVRVNVYKDKIKNAGGLPALPQQQALHDALAGTYSELRKIGLTRAATTRPVHLISDAQQVLAECFLSTLQKYFKGLMADLRAYCITDVSPSLERTSVLLKDSFVESFPPRDRAFMRQFTETQMFSVYSDAVMG